MLAIELMAQSDPLAECFDRVVANQGSSSLLSDYELAKWPLDTVSALKSQNLLVQAPPALSAVCPGCEDECVIPVETISSTDSQPMSFVVCDSRSDTNRVPIPQDHLKQWQCHAELISAFVANAMEFTLRMKKQDHTLLWEIGIATGKKRSQMLCLEVDNDLFLVAGNNRRLLKDDLQFQNNHYVLDIAAIHRLVDASTTADPRHTPSKIKREANKLVTQERYQSWHKEYIRLKKEKPGHSDVWYSQQIAKIDIAQGRDAGTIRKNMKFQK